MVSVALYAGFWRNASLDSFAECALKESGLAHSAFTFAHESLVARSVVADSEVPPGALLSFLQKGLQYVEIETHLQEDGTERACDEPFYLLSPHVCRLRPAKSTEVEGIVAHTATNLQTNFTAADIRGLLGHLSEVFSLAWSPSGSALVSGGSDGTARVWQVSERSTSGGEVPCLVLRPAQGGAAAAGSSGAVDLKPRKDKSDVTRVEWHPQGQLLATASIDGRARLWLCQGGGGGGEAGGKLVHTLSMHTGQIFDMAFSPSGTLLATAGVDKSVVLWDSSTGEARAQHTFHTAPVLAVAWASETMYASGSTDRLVLVCNVGERTPSRTFSGHTDEVNSVAWSPASSLLASGSDDGTVRLWTLSAMAGVDSSGCIAACSGHSKSVYKVCWSPTGEGSGQPSKPAFVASASFDGDVRIWDVASLVSSAGSNSSSPAVSPTTVPSGPSPMAGTASAHARGCLHTLSAHNGPVYSISWSPDGDYIASAGSDKSVNVWRVADGAHVRRFNGPSPCMDVAWSKDGQQVAAAYANGAVVLLDIRL